MYDNSELSCGVLKHRKELRYSGFCVDEDDVLIVSRILHIIGPLSLVIGATYYIIKQSL